MAITFNNKEFYEGQIEFAKKMIGFAERSLEFNKRQLSRERKSDKELVEYVWSKGVVTKFEMETYTKDYKGTETKKLEKDSKRERKNIRKYKAQIEKYEAKLAECK